MTECLLHRAAVRFRVCVAFVLFLSASSALAQATKPQVWTASAVPGEFPSQQAALAAVRSLGGVYALADKVQSISPTATQISYVYEATPRPPTLGEWGGYSGWLNSPYASEAEAVAALQASGYTAPGCPGPVVVPVTGWSASRYWNFSQYVDQESRTYHLKYYWTNSPCQLGVRDHYLKRTRPVSCPAGLKWNGYGDTPDYHTCIKRDIASIRTVPMPCSSCGDFQHNPVSVSTGNKFQSETDFSLPWLNFSRHYHSAATAPAGKLGPGWTHDLNVRVYVNGSYGAGVLMPRGEILPFAQNGVSYEAVDGSGKRVNYTNGRYYLKGSDRTINFDSARRAERIEYPSGEALALVYDSFDRLKTATHSSGRSIVFEYASGFIAANAPIARITTNGVELVRYEYDTQGRLEFARYPNATARRYHYENAQYPTHLTGISDESDTRYSTYGYNADGLATLSEHVGGLYRGTFDYLTDGKATYTDANGRQQTFAFTGGSNYRKIIDVADATGAQSTTYDTDFRRRPLTRLDKRGVQTTYAYSDYTSPSLGDVRLTTTTEAVGTEQSRISQVWRDRKAGYVLKMLQSGTDLIYQRNTRGQPTSVTRKDTATSLTRTTSRTYCEQADITAGTCPLLGLVTSINGPRADVNDLTTYTYYPSDDASCATAPTTCPHRKGDLWLVQDATGNTTETLKYDGAGRVLSVKDANNVVTDFEYHARGWLTARKVRGTDNSSEADDQITRIDYFPTGLVQKTTLPDGSYTSYTYDAAHRLTDITDGEGNKIHYTLDNAGNRTREETLGATGTMLRTLSRVYNQLGQLQTHKDAFEHGTGYVYDANGNTDTVTDALSRVTDNDYDPLNRLSKSIQDVGGLNVTTQFKYDAQDNLTEVIDPKNLSTKYTYDGLGDLKRLESPDTGITDYTYDSAGNRKTQTDARGVTATYGYDALNRLTSVAYPDSSLNVGYSYDTAATACATGETFAAGRLSQLLDASGSTQYCYDRFGQMVRKVQTTNGQAFTVRYAYTKAGQLSSVTYPDGTVADYVRDGLGRTTEVGVTRPGQSRQVLLTAASYYPFGPASEWVFGNGRLFQRTLNQNYQPGVVQDQGAGGLSLGYEFDAVGNLMKLRQGDQSEPPLRRYGYDALNRLSESHDGVTDALLEG